MTSRRLLLVLFPWYSCSAKASPLDGFASVIWLREDGCYRVNARGWVARWKSLTRRLSSRAETAGVANKASCMYVRVVRGRGRWHSFAAARIACEQPCRARSEGEPKLARRCVVLGSATIRIKPVAGRLRFRLSTNRPKSRRKLVTPGKPLFWLCQSPPLAVTSFSGNSACPSAQSTAAKATCCFFASAPA